MEDTGIFAKQESQVWGNRSVATLTWVGCPESHVLCVAEQTKPAVVHAPLSATLHVWWQEHELEHWGMVFKAAVGIKNGPI